MTSDSVFRNNGCRDRRGAVAFLLGIALAIVCRYYVDLPVAEWCWYRHYGISGHRYSAFVQNLFVLMEVFGTWLGIVLVVGLICELDRFRWSRTVRFLAAVLCAGLTVNAIKLFVVRLRPQGFRFREPDLVLEHNVISFDWAPWASTFRNIENSFPSGHTATAFAACAVLSAFYPQGKRIFLLLALLVGVQRIMVCAHFPSDVIVGAMIGLSVGGACTTFRPLARVCQRKHTAPLEP